MKYLEALTWYFHDGQYVNKSQKLLHPDRIYLSLVLNL
jgi:hypothetical protein